MWPQKVMSEVERTKSSGDDFLEKFAMTIEEGDGAVSFSKRVVGFLRFRDDHDFHFAPGIEMET